jgi:DNA-binding response OmpR family regulator
MNNILLLDDDADFLEILTIILEEAKFRVYAKPNAIGVEKELAHYKPDAIVVDFDMPQIDGLSFTKLVRKLPRFSHIPIIIMSAHRNISEDMKAGGTDVFLPKPFDTQHLVKLLRTLIRK